MPIFLHNLLWQFWHLLYLMWAICFWVYQLHLSNILEYWNWLLGLHQGLSFMSWVYSYWQSYSFSPWYSAPLDSPPLSPSSILPVLQATSMQVWRLLCPVNFSLLACLALQLVMLWFVLLCRRGCRRRYWRRHHCLVKHLTLLRVSHIPEAKGLCYPFQKQCATFFLGIDISGNLGFQGYLVHLHNVPISSLRILWIS